MPTTRPATTPPAIRLLAAVGGAITLALVVLMSVVGPASPANAQQETSTTAVTTDADSPIGNILPRPNSGNAPDSANDPGGWQQYMVFALIGLGLLGIVALATRESRRIRRAQGRYPS